MIIRETELKHYGVLGMKWGHRKAYYGARAEHYKSLQNKHINKINTSKTRLGKEYHNLRAYSNEAKRHTASDLSRDSGIRNTVSNVMVWKGRGDRAARLGASANYHQRKQGYTLTKIGKRINEAREYNDKSLYNANNNVRKTKLLSGQRIVKSIDAAINTPLKTAIRHKNTTTGKRAVRNILITGAASYILK